MYWLITEFEENNYSVLFRRFCFILSRASEVRAGSLGRRFSSSSCRRCSNRVCIVVSWIWYRRQNLQNITCTRIFRRFFSEILWSIDSEISCVITSQGEVSLFIRRMLKLIMCFKITFIILPLLPIRTAKPIYLQTMSELGTGAV